MTTPDATPVIDTLVDFVLDLEPEALPPAVSQAASLCLMDWLGTPIRGSTEPLAEALAAVVRASGGKPQATVVGRDVRTSGLLAALLAREGFTGPAGILDGAGGLPGTFLGVTDMAPALEGLGKRWEILENSTKPYAACHLTHATIDAGRAIRARSAPAPDSIAAVECLVHPLTLKVAANPGPRTGLEGKFSIAFCAAGCWPRPRAAWWRARSSRCWRRTRRTARCRSR